MCLEFIFGKVFFLTVAIRKFLRLNTVKNHLPNLFFKDIQTVLDLGIFYLKMPLFLFWRLLHNQRPFIKLLLACCHNIHYSLIEFSFEFCLSCPVEMPLPWVSSSLSLPVTTRSMPVSYLVFWFWSLRHTAPRNSLTIKTCHVTPWFKNLHCLLCLLENKSCYLDWPLRSSQPNFLCSLCYLPPLQPHRTFQEISLVACSLWLKCPLSPPDTFTWKNFYYLSMLSPARTFLIRPSHRTLWHMVKYKIYHVASEYNCSRTTWFELCGSLTCGFFQ